MASILAPALSPSSASMPSRRVPLGAIPTAANANYNMVTATNVKRPRSQSITQREGNFTQQPPIKKQIVEVPQAQPIMRTPVRNRNEPKVMPPRRSTNRTRTVGGSPPPFNPIGVATQQSRRTTADAVHEEQRKRASHAAAGRNDDNRTNEGIEKIRAWQGHYRRVFPTFNFFFESVPADVAAKYQRQVQALGATVEKFFSNTVTHVITTRQIPPESAVKSSSQQSQQKSTPSTSQSSTRVSNILLDRAGIFNGQTHARAEFTFKAPQGSKKFTSLAKVDTHARNVVEEPREKDPPKTILQKARDLGIKIWALEKLQRMLNAMVDLGDNSTQRAIQPRADGAENTHRMAHADAELSRLLRNERLHGPSDRDPDAVSKDMVYFQGPFIMVRDMKSTHRPIMVREYEKVAKREDGSWPQFRSTSSGKCPFIDEFANMKERERENKEAREAKELLKQRRAKEDEDARLKAVAKMQPPAVPRQRHKTLEDVKPQDSRLNNGRVTAATTSRILHNPPTSRLFSVSSVVPAKRISNEMAFTSTSKASTGNNTSQNPRYAYEPAASGLQQSNITSAIRSQVVSSFVDIPGAKTAMSKDMLDLKRKATGNIVDPSRRTAMPNSQQRVLDLAGLAAGKAEPRTALRKEAQRPVKPIPIFEDVEPVKQKRSLGGGGGKHFIRNEVKPGYCENCREKFEDFDAHTASRRHRKFATNQANFADLDKLLKELARPVKQRAH